MFSSLIYFFALKRDFNQNSSFFPLFDQTDKTKLERQTIPRNTMRICLFRRNLRYIICMSSGCLFDHKGPHTSNPSSCTIMIPLLLFTLVSV